MRHGEITAINGEWSDDAHAWVSETLQLTGDCWLEVTLPDKGRLVIKKSDTEDGPFPKALITKWTGPDFRIRIFHGTFIGDGDPPQGGVIERGRYIKICTTKTPTTIQFSNI